jgi:DNA-binding response OmpR family regulator
MMTKRSTDPHVLIVEHDELTTATYARMLRLEGYQVQTAVSAEDGLRAAESSHLDAIIVDFRLPGMDGLEFLRRLRARRDTRRTPVAIVTGDYFLDDTIPAELRELGAEVRFKPLWLEDLVTLIRGLLTPAIVDVDRISDSTQRKSEDDE